MNTDHELAAVQYALLLGFHSQYSTCFLRRMSVDESHLIANHSPPPFLPPTGDVVFKDRVFFVFIPEHSLFEPDFSVWPLKQFQSCGYMKSLDFDDGDAL